MLKFAEGSASDAQDIARLYLQCFPDSVGFFFPGRDAAEVSVPVSCGFQLVLLSGCLPLLVRNQDNDLVGYCIVSTKNGIPFHRLLHPKRIRRTLAVCLRAVLSLRIRELLLLTRNWLTHISTVVQDDTPAKLAGGRIVSIAVHHTERGKGVGKKLLECAIRYLEEHQIGATYLEVRPDNIAARKMYERFGFHQYGQNRDLQGVWLRLVRINNVPNRLS